VTTFQIKLSSEDRLVAPSQKAPEAVVPTYGAKQAVGGDKDAPRESVSRHKKS
jgi:hypothetical protein